MKKTSSYLILLAIGATLSAAPATFAQDGSDANNATTNTTTTYQREESPDYSWLGLLGLAGLAGLLKKPERQVVHHTETVHTPATGPVNRR